MQCFPSCRVHPPAADAVLVFLVPRSSGIEQTHHPELLLPEGHALSRGEVEQKCFFEFPAGPSCQCHILNLCAEDTIRDIDRWIRTQFVRQLRLHYGMGKE